MSQPELISVIVPVYKVEKYLDQCVQSIVDQTYQNLEIILVDDGSPDNCPAMCDAWAEKDSRIKVIHQTNSGAGAARNAGFSVATGKYIALVDSDDYLAADAYEYMLSLMEDDVDVVECGFRNTTDDVCDFCCTDTAFVQKMDVHQAMKEHILDRSFRQMPVTKLYRRVLIMGINFPIGKLIDDEFWTYQVLGRARYLVSSSKEVYAYRQQPDSAMHQTYSLRRLQALEAKVQRLDYLRIRFPQLIPEATINFWFSALYQGQMSLRYLCEQEQEKAFAQIYNHLRAATLTGDALNTLPMRHRFWLTAAKIHFKATCKLRNALCIGC